MSKWFSGCLWIAITSALLGSVSGCSSTTVAEYSPSVQHQDRPVVVCQGLADVDGGIAALRPESVGRVIEVPVREGEHVKQGAVLARLDDSAARLEVMASKAKLRAAQAALDQAEQQARRHPTQLQQRRAVLAESEARLAGAKVTLKRQQDLVEKRLTSQSEADVARERVRELTAAVNVARGQVSELSSIDPKLPVLAATASKDAAEVRLEQAELARSHYEVRAPSAGVVQQVDLRVGEVAGPAASSTIEFCPDEPWQVRAEVEQEFAGEIHAGQPVRVRDEMAGRGPWPGRVLRVGGVYQRRRMRLDPAGFKDVPTVECVIRLEPGHPPLRVGQRLRVTIYRAEAEAR